MDNETLQRRSVGDPSMSPSEQLLREMMKLSRLQAVLMHRIQDKLSLYPGQPQLMMYLLHHQMTTDYRPSQRELATHLHVRPATLTVTLRRMERAGLLNRAPDNWDARVQRVSLSDKGVEVTIQLQHEFHETANAFFASLGDTQIEQILSRLSQLNEHLIDILPGRKFQEEAPI